MVAMEIARALERAGAEVIGPAPTVEAALDAPGADGARRSDPRHQPGAKIAFSVADALLGPWNPVYFCDGV
jgi:hypothetical protein